MISQEHECPVCGCPSQALFQKDGYWIYQCEQCHHRFTPIEPQAAHTTQIYDDSYFTEGGAGYPDYLSEADLLIAHGRYYARILSRYMRPGTVLDVGAAAGFILKGLSDSGWHGRGIEPNPTMVAFAVEKLGLEACVGTLEDYQTDETFDLVSMVQVVAHFYDLRATFSQATRLLRPEGFLLVETWNKDSFVARGLGEYWHECSPPSVLHWFSPLDLRLLVEQFGFHEVARGRPKKWLNGAHAKSLVADKLKTSALRHLMTLVPDNLPIPYPNFDLFWGLYQRTA
jgi:SAM-dependent methyltransferase